MKIKSLVIVMPKNPWMEHLKKYIKKGESLKTAIQKAKQTYKKKK